MDCRLSKVAGMVVMFVSVTAVFANSMRGKWTMMFWTLLDVVKDQALKPRAAG